MSGVTASRGEMMQVTPDVARDQRELSVFLFLFFSAIEDPLEGENPKENPFLRNNVPILIRKYSNPFTHYYTDNLLSQ